MIFDDSPSDWSQLEDQVAQAFNEMGCKATTDVTIPKIRSDSRIDVYVEDPTLSPPAIYLCECKYWKKSVHKGVVQQFRTIIYDAGANLGIIISQNRFQRGALEEAKKTNVRLYSWLDFQKAFEKRWTKEMAERFSKLAFENKNLACELYDMGIKPEHREEVQERTLDLVRRTALLANITFWRDTVFEKHRSVRFCESGPESNASQAGRWVELRTKREFYDYAILLGEELKLKYHELFSILHTHTPS